MTQNDVVSVHGWTVELDKVIAAVTDDRCQLGLHNAVAMLPGQREGVAENPHRAAVEKGLRAVCRRCEVPHYDRLFGPDGIGQLAALCFPAANRQQLRVCTLAMLLALMFDDLLDVRAQGSVATLVQALKNALAGVYDDDFDHDFLVSLAEELGASVRELGPSQSWLERFTGGFHAFFDMAVKAYKRWLEGDQSLELSGYLYERYFDIGVGPMLSLMELTHDYELPENRFDHHELAAFRAACIYYMVFVNDIFSYHKEVVESGNFTNAIAVVQAQFNVSLAQAVAAVALMALRCYGEFESRAFRIIHDETLTQREHRYVAGMRDWMTGALEWSRGSQRYRHPDSPVPELRTTKPVTPQHIEPASFLAQAVR